jgi:hypothetical protein
MGEQVAPKAAELEKACDKFLAHYLDALPRVAERGLKEVLSALAVVARGQEGCTAVSLIQWLTKDGVRVPMKTEIIPGEMFLISEVIYDLESDSMFYRPIPVGGGPANTVFVALIGGAGRKVELVQLIEMGVSAEEVVRSIRNLASATSFSEVVSQATQKPALA